MKFGQSAIARPVSSATRVAVGLSSSYASFTTTVTNRGCLTFTNNNRGENSVIECLDIHISHIELNNNDGLSFRENFAFRFNPRDDLTLCHSGPEGRHEDLPDLGLDDGDPPAGFGGKYVYLPHNRS